MTPQPSNKAAIIGIAIWALGGLGILYIADHLGQIVGVLLGLPYFLLFRHAISAASRWLGEE